jgi:hypothetical protein
MPMCIGALAGCGNSDVDATSKTDAGERATSSGGAASASGGASSGASPGAAAASGGSTGSGGRTTASGGRTSSAGTSAATGGAANGHAGAPDAGADATPSGCATYSCTNPSHTIQMDPGDPQAGITLSGYYVDTDTWNAANYQVTQTMYVCDYDNWYVIANMNDDKKDGAVKTYPNVHKDFNSSPKISSFTEITSCFAHTAPHVGVYEFAYDIWLNGVASSGSTEVMIWTDNYFQTPSGSAVETVTFDGQSYEVHRSGNYIAFVATKNVTSGTVNLLSFFEHIISKGWIPDTSTIGAIDYGVELVSTNGADTRFEVNNFTLTTN